MIHHIAGQNTLRLVIDFKAEKRIFISILFSGQGHRQRAPSAKHQTDLTESLEEAVGGVGGETEGGGREAEDHRTQKSKGPAHGLLVRRIYAMLQVIYSV